MLKNIPSILPADLLWVLAAMGHGDDLVIVDRNFPACSVARQTVSGRLIPLPGVNTTEAARAICTLFPLDTFVETPLLYMEEVGNPDALLEVHHDMRSVCNAAEGRAVPIKSIERYAFYEASKKAFAIVHTTEDRPYGCFILKKGVVFD